MGMSLQSSFEVPAGRIQSWLFALSPGHDSVMQLWHICMNEWCNAYHMKLEHTSWTETMFR